MYFHSQIELETHMTEFIRSRRTALQATRLGEPSVAVVALAAAAGRVGRLAAMIERWARGASEAAVTPVPTSITRTATR